MLTGRCPAYGEGITLWPLREVVLQARGDRSPDELAAALGIPAVAVRRVAAAVGLEDGEPGEDTDWAFLQLLGALARVGPLVIVIDDAHWAEPALLDLLLDLVARLRDAPVLVVWVARPDLLESARRPGGAGVHPDAAAAVAPRRASRCSRRSAGGRLRPDEERRIAEAAGGNPLFLEQLVAYVGEQRAADALPPALQALLAARLDRLDAAERSALALGAITGDRFDAGAVHALAAGITRAEVERACERLVERDLLVRDERLALRFRHTLIRDVAYASLAKSARARLHERHAAWLEELGSELPEADARIGFHLESACRFAARDRRQRRRPRWRARAGRRLAAAARRRARPRRPRRRDRVPRPRGGPARRPTTPEGAELLPGLVSALFESGASDRAEALADARWR